MNLCCGKGDKLWFESQIGVGLPHLPSSLPLLPSHIKKNDEYQTEAKQKAQLYLRSSVIHYEVKEFEEHEENTWTKIDFT